QNRHTFIPHHFSLENRLQADERTLLNHDMLASPIGARLYLGNSTRTSRSNRTDYILFDLSDPAAKLDKIFHSRSIPSDLSREKKIQATKKIPREKWH
ncbi:MAG: hypothetical protein AABZ09_06225, partial [Candidatus Binatota bacterium]